MKFLSSAGRSTQVLLAVLGVQLVLAALLYWQSIQSAQFTAADQLFDFAAQVVDQVLISDGEDEIKLVRSAESWQMQAVADFQSPVPADTDKVNEVIESLATLSAGLPVATSQAAQAQLEVAEDKFQRHLTLLAGENQEAEFYLGTSPGFRKAHMRMAGAKAIHAAKINVFDLPIKADDWLDKSLLAPVAVERLRVEGFTLVRNDDVWSVSEPAVLPEAKQLDVDKVNELIKSLESLRVTGLSEALKIPDGAAQNSTETNADSDTATADEAAVAIPTLVEQVLQVTSEGQDSVLTFQQLGDDATLTHSDSEGVFSISQSEFEKFNQLDLNSFLKDTESAAGASPEYATGTSSDTGVEATSSESPGQASE